MTPKILAIEKRPFRQRLAFPVLWVFGPWAACTLTYNNAWRFLDPSIHRPLAVFCAVVMGILIVFGAALIYPVTFFRGASWRERAIACLIIPFLWTVKELHMMPNCYSLAEKLFYARPHVLDDGTFALIMRDRLSHHNLQSNPKAAYLFVEEGPGYKGKRFFMTKVGEEEDQEKIHSFRRRSHKDSETDSSEAKFLVYFRIDKEFPLIGSGV